MGTRKVTRALMAKRIEWTKRTKMVTTGRCERGRKGLAKAE